MVYNKLWNVHHKVNPYTTSLLRKS
jgi:hypothetical protein